MAIGHLLDIGAFRAIDSSRTSKPVDIWSGIGCAGGLGMRDILPVLGGIPNSPNANVIIVVGEEGWSNNAPL